MISDEERKNILSEFKARHSPTAEDARRLGEWLDERRAHRVVGHKPEHVEKRLQEALRDAETRQESGQAHEHGPFVGTPFGEACKVCGKRKDAL